MNDSSLYIEFARKASMSADFRKSCELLIKLKPQVQGREWLEVQQLLIACHRELMQTKEVNFIFQELGESLKTLPPELHSRVYYLLSACANLLGNQNGVLEFSQSALSLALQYDHREDLQYALFAGIMVSRVQGDNVRMARDIEKLEMLLEQYPKVEISASLILLKIAISSNSSQAQNLCWTAYEFMKASGFYIYIPHILCRLVSINIEEKSFGKAEAFLSLAEKGVNQENHPLLYTFLQSERAKFEKVRPRFDHDLEVEVENKIIREKTLGAVDFKNQHTLLEMALLLIQNPDQTFSKEDLIEKIWHQSYRPNAHDNLIYVTVRRLRELIEPDIQSPRYILRNRQGYYFNPQTKLLIKEGCSL